MADFPAETADPISPALLDLLAVFEGPLAEVQFPGVDRGSLRTLIDQVREGSLELDTLRAQLEALHNQLTETRVQLIRAAEQGLAYARIYAATDPELEARLAAITLAPNGKPEPRRRKSDLSAAKQPAEAGDGEPLRLPPRRGRKPREAGEAPTAEAPTDEAPTGS